MNPERWRIVKEVFQVALLQEKTRRAAYLNQRCADDPSVHAEVAAMLAFDEQGGDFIEARIATMTGELFGNDVPLCVGTELGDHRILSLLGAGGMGEVYLAEDTRLGRKVALKVLPSPLRADDRSAARLMREARVASALNHSNICTIYEVGVARGRSFISMQYVEGDTVQRIVAGQPLQVGRLLSIALQVAHALRAAHAAGIVHRDVKSSNIMVTPQGEVKVLDFGIAKRLDAADTPAQGAEALPAGTWVGTPAYLSPEQAIGASVDHRSDLFSLGVVLYEMATGRVPFTGRSATEVMHAIIHEPHTPVSALNAGIWPQLATVIDRALGKAPAERYQSAEEMIAALRAVTEAVGISASHLLDDAQVDATPRSLATGLRRMHHWSWRSGRPAWRVAVSAGVIALTGVIASIVGFPAPPAAIDSIAVLPFTHAGADLEYLSDGLTESLTGQLSHLSQLKVIARSTAFRYKGRKLDPSIVGRELGVRSVLTGHLVQQGDMLVIWLELVDVQDGSRAWGEQYSRPLTGVYALPGELAVDVSRHLRPQLGTHDEELLARNYTQDSEAYQLFLRGRYFFNKITADGSKRAIGYFQQAIDRDPTYALAYAGLADSYLLLRGYGILPVEETVPNARAAALKARELDPGIAETRTTLGLLSMRTRGWAEAETEYRRAIELNPNSESAHHLYAMLLTGLARFPEAMAEMRRAQQLDPLSLQINTEAGRIFFFMRRYDEAIAYYQKTLEMDENFAAAHLQLGAAYEEKRMYEEAIAAYRKAQSLGGRLPAARIGRAYALWGKRRQASQILDEFEEASKTGFVPYVGMAWLYGGMGQNEKALAWLEKALDAGVGDVFLNVDPAYDSLRAEPKFRLLLQRAGLVQ